MDGDFHMPTPLPTSRAERQTAPHTALSDLPAYDVRHMMAGGTTALMVLDGTAYTLRITRAGKLILTK